MSLEPLIHKLQPEHDLQIQRLHPVLTGCHLLLQALSDLICELKFERFHKEQCELGQVAPQRLGLRKFLTPVRYEVEYPEYFYHLVLHGELVCLLIQGLEKAEELRFVHEPLRRRFGFLVLGLERGLLHFVNESCVDLAACFLEVGQLLLMVELLVIAKEGQKNLV